ncbi:nitroreductase family protein [Mycolicibacterium sp. S2-37]|uniref:nitroreductase family protein n=1 Tax=Mycolicibacterium sp. S2-37 TaxID=2810297 RepID=UPI001A95389D|nr:nitroreductase family protein [Mycolicibacterium sp. S2-37]MBO0681057.1 nitroreductase family protein [Mycolicibacterium sp. S2-37]
MASPPSDRQAHTRVPIHPDIAARWSPRSFDPAAVVTADQLTALLEAARWAATWGARQPVRFLVGLRGDETFDTLAGVLRRGNSYATAAGALILVCADDGEDERTARYAAVDAGAAMANMGVEAVARGLVTHPMAGFDGDAAAARFGVPQGVRPIAVVAVGTLGESTDAAITERDARPRERLDLDEIAFAGRWGEPFPVIRTLRPAARSGPRTAG